MHEAGCTNGKTDIYVISSSENKASWMIWMTGGVIALGAYYFVKSSYPSLLQQSIKNLSQRTI